MAHHGPAIQTGLKQPSCSNFEFRAFFFGKEGEAQSPAPSRVAIASSLLDREVVRARGRPTSTMDIRSFFKKSQAVASATSNGENAGSEQQQQQSQQQPKISPIVVAAKPTTPTVIDLEDDVVETPAYAPQNETKRHRSVVIDSSDDEGHKGKRAEGRRGGRSTVTPVARARHACLPKGVAKVKGRKKKPFRISLGVGRVGCYATQEEAVNALNAYKRAKIQARASARAALAPKRARDVARYGNNIKMERDIVIALAAEWRKTGHPAIVMNDGTIPDIILGLGSSGDDSWLPVQMKTTSQARLKNGKSRCWQFQQVTGYAGFPVLAYRHDHQDSWCYDGTTLETRGIPGLTITPNGKNDRLALARGLKLPEVVTWIQRHADRWPMRITEHEARRWFASENAELEFKGMEEYKRRFPSPHYKFPDEQGSHIDLMKGTLTYQFKTAKPSGGGSAGFRVGLQTSGGTDERGIKIKTPYPTNAFDVLVAVAFVDEKAHFWEVPSSDLERRGYFVSATCAGKETLYLHNKSIGIQPNPHAKRKCDTWTWDFVV